MKKDTFFAKFSVVELEPLNGVPILSTRSSRIIFFYAKISGARGPWFEPGQRTLLKLDELNRKFKFSALFGPFLHLKVSFGNK